MVLPCMSLFFMPRRFDRVMEVPGKEGEEDQSGGGWITPGMTCRRTNCQGRKRKTGLNRGVS